MNDNQPKIGKFSWTYGLLLGVASVIFGFMLYTMEMHYEQGWAVRIVGIVLMVAAVVLAVMQYKKANSGFLKIVDAVKLGAGIGVVSAIISLIWYALLTNVIEPDFMDKAMELAKVQAMAQNPQMTDEQWQQGVEIQKSFAWLAYPIGIVVNVIFGLIIGAIVGAIMKNTDPNN
ncbi:DUF4199 domain-containing protein [Aurantibacter crassamenti]|uniref:DUF4199 domain-containing protein n=1 Tax=Aurantibacter crassamenti TaxID=1837375 RepID=UPI0019398D8D|nr:DUF4199 domain-containing protein [Aurantibacter crassamenti]MBM1107606.1 DUF4199 domain-containing protein [Aurantibacter crassamenti]